MEKKETLKELIDRYDNGIPIETVEMGGIGERYELAIQELAIEIMRNLKNRKPSTDSGDNIPTVNIFTMKAVESMKQHYGFSGAQVGAAKNLASIYWIKGYVKSLNEMKKKDAERIILVQKGENSKMELINTTTPKP